MAAGGFFECAPAAQSVRHNRRAGGRCAAPRAISRFRKPLTGANFSLRGCPSALVETAATEGVLPAETGVVHLNPPRKRRLPFAPRHHRHNLMLHGPGRRLLDPETAAEPTDEMPFFAVTIRWMAANQSVSGSLVAWKIVPAVGDVCFFHRLHG